jgi:hypothetical protein
MCKPASDSASIHPHRLIEPLRTHLPIPVAARSKAWVCGRSLAGITGWTLAGVMGVCLLWVLCAVRCLCDELLIRTEEFYRVWWGIPDPLRVATQWKKKLSTNHPSIHPPTLPSTHPPIHPSTYLPTYLPTYLSFLSIFLAICSAHYQLRSFLLCNIVHYGTRTKITIMTTIMLMTMMIVLIIIISMKDFGLLRCCCF